MWEALQHSFSIYHGLDWLSLITGLVGTYLITNKNYWGFIWAFISCANGFSIALISQQFGFIVYNAILMALMARGFMNWSVSKSTPAKAKTYSAVRKRSR